MKIKISADSTCDLPRTLLDEYDIGITPLYIVNEKGSFRDGVEITPDDVFAYAEQTGQICSTSAVSIADYLSYWSQWKQTYDAIIHISLSAELSTTHNNACLAAQELGGVWVLDSRNLSTGIGHLAIEAAELARQGLEPEAIMDVLRGLVDKLDVSFVLDTLRYLRKGGRCSALAALGANLLNLKPCIEVRGGKMDVGKKYRGRTDRAYLQYIRDRLGDRDDIDLHRVFITDSGISDECREELERTVLACQPFEQVYHNRAGCTISNHCGPWCMGVLYFHK